jgi:hypothetical protein
VTRQVVEQTKNGSGSRLRRLFGNLA